MTSVVPKELYYSYEITLISPIRYQMIDHIIAVLKSIKIIIHGLQLRRTTRLIESMLWEKANMDVIVYNDLTTLKDRVITILYAIRNSSPSSAPPSSALPSSALPSSAPPSSALPSSALPSSALPSSAPPSSALPSSALPSSAPPLTPEMLYEIVTSKVGIILSERKLNDSQVRIFGSQIRLLELRHASMCVHKDNKCPLKKRYCEKMKRLWEHLDICQNPRCGYQSCLSSKRCLHHHNHCEDMQCLICIPLKDAFKYSEIMLCFSDRSDKQKMD